MRKSLCVLLCIALLCCTLPAMATGESYSMGSFHFSLPEGFEMQERDDYGMIALKEETDGETLQKAWLIGVCIDNSLKLCESFGVTLDWVKAELANPNSDYVVNMINNSPTLNVGYTDEEMSGAHSLIATYINGSLVIGYEMILPTEYRAGQYILDIMREMAGDTDKSLISGTEEAEAFMKANMADYQPEDCADWKVDASQIITRGTDGYLFCGLEWNTDIDTALKTIAGSTGRTMSVHGSGEGYMGVAAMELPVLKCTLALCTLIMGEPTWSIECQLTPDGVALLDDPTEAAQWFGQLLETANTAFGGFSGAFCMRSAGDGKQSVEAVLARNAESTEITAFMNEWEAKAKDEQSTTQTIEVYYDNMTLALEPYEYEDRELYMCWLYLSADGKLAQMMAAQ